jgi:hypothetical protein
MTTGDNKKLYKTFHRESEAKSWRADAKRSLDQGRLRAPGGQTIREAGEAWLEGAERGEIRNRSGRPFKPSTLRGYRQTFIDRIIPTVGHVKVAALTTSDLQVVVDQWQVEGHAASTVRNSLRPLQAIYRRARAREGVPVNPTRDLELPASDRREIEMISPATAAAPLDKDRPIWATALYAGLRSGELRALPLGSRRSVEESKGGAGRAKDQAITATGASPTSSATSCSPSGRSTTAPKPSSLASDTARRSSPRSSTAMPTAPGITPASAIACASTRRATPTPPFMIAAGVNAKALSSFMGHASITVTFDLYGHLMPGSEAEGAALLDAYLDERGDD